MCAWNEVYYQEYTLTVGTGTLVLTTYTTTIGFMSWRRSMWCFTWFERTCFILFVIEIIVFLYAYDYLDEIFDYETHTIFFFVVSLVPMVLFIYSLSARTSLDLDHLYENFILYYRNKLKERPPVQTEDIKLNVPENANVQIENSKDKDKDKSEQDAEQNEEERQNEVNVINMSLLLSKISMESGERSHSGNIPQAFPEMQDSALPEILNETKIITAETRYRQEFEEILNMTTNFAKTSETVKCILYLIVVAIAYVIYNVEYRMYNDKKIYTRIGIVQTFYLIYFDILIISWSKSKLSESPRSITESSLLMLVCRISLGTTVRYWVIAHCIIYTVLSSIIGTSLCDY